MSRKSSQNVDNFAAFSTHESQDGHYVASTLLKRKCSPKNEEQSEITLQKLDKQKGLSSGMFIF